MLQSGGPYSRLPSTLSFALSSFATHPTFAALQSSFSTVATVITTRTAVTTSLATSGVQPLYVLEPE